MARTSTVIEVARVLAGEAPYDALSDEAQALVRASWDRRVRDRLAALDLEGRLRATGTPWAEADADGTVILCQAGPPSGDPADG